jgi:hypothetical protein
MSNPQMNSSDKSLEASIGTMMLCTFYNGVFRLEINPAYYERELLGSPTKPIVVSECKLGESLYEKLPEHREEFKKAGIELVVGGNLSTQLQTRFEEPLITLVLKKDEKLLECLGFLDLINFPDM